MKNLNIWQNILKEKGFLEGKASILQIIVEYYDEYTFTRDVNTDTQYNFSIIENKFNLLPVIPGKLFEKWRDVIKDLQNNGRQFTAPMYSALKDRGSKGSEVRIVKIKLKTEETVFFKPTILEFYIKPMFMNFDNFEVTLVEFPLKFDLKDKINEYSGWFLLGNRHVSHHIQAPAHQTNIIDIFSWKENSITHVRKIIEFKARSSVALDLQKDASFFIFPGLLFSYFEQHFISELYFCDGHKLYFYPCSILTPRERYSQFIIKYGIVNSYFFPIIDWWWSKYPSNKTEIVENIGVIYYYTELFRVFSSEFSVVINESIIDTVLELLKQRKILTQNRPRVYCDLLKEVLLLSAPNVYKPTLEKLHNFRGLLVHRFAGNFEVEGKTISHETAVKIRRFVEALSFLCILFLLCKSANVRYNTKDIDYLLLETRKMLDEVRSLLQTDGFSV